MSDFYQPGQHPDADQLSAFAEGALPAHEREQTLAHLAGCADCRTIVSLALPPMEDVPQLQPAAARRPWFYGWNVAWLAGAGLTALIFLTVHIRNGGHEEKNAATPPQTAEVRPEAAPSVAPVAPAVTSAAPAPALKTPRAEANSHPSGSVENPKTTLDGATINSQEIANLPLQGRMYLSQPQQQQMTQQQIQQQQAAAMRGSIGGASAGTGQALFRQRSPGVEADANAAGKVITGTPVAAAPVLSAQAPQAPAPPPPPAKPAAQTTDTLAVEAEAAAMDTTNASASMVLMSPGVVNVHGLPSHLAIASKITRGKDMLALDTAGALFHSTDDGRHWKTVAAPWPGHAVRVALTSLPMPAAKLPMSSFSSDSGSGSTLSGLDLNAVRTPSVIGVVTDPTGAIIPGASIKITDTRTGTSVATASDRNGRYAAGGLAPDAYQIDATAIGFQSWRGTVTVAAAQQSVVNIRLTVGAISETVEVSAGSPMVSDKAQRKSLRTAKAAPVSEPSAVFEVTTDGGELWTSVDGKSWKRK